MARLLAGGHGAEAGPRPTPRAVVLREADLAGVLRHVDVRWRWDRGGIGVSVHIYTEYGTPRAR
jgi:hypothetical protein